jgi:hypothetical protein
MTLDIDCGHDPSILYFLKKPIDLMHIQNGGPSFWFLCLLISPCTEKDVGA